MQRTDELSERLALAMKHHLSSAQACHRGLRRALAQQHPAPLVTHKQRQLVTVHDRLQMAARNHLQRQRQRWTAGARTLQAVSPLHTIGRGYAVMSTADRQWVTSVTNVAPGDKLSAHLHDGVLDVEVLKRDDDNWLPEVFSFAVDKD